MSYAVFSISSDGCSFFSEEQGIFCGFLSVKGIDVGYHDMDT